MEIKRKFHLKDKEEIRLRILVEGDINKKDENELIRKILKTEDFTECIIQKQN